MSEPYCRVILTECGSTWHRMVSFVEIVRRVTTIIKLVSANMFGVEDPSNYTKSISKFANLLNIKEAFESCSDFEQCPYSKVSLLCESFVTFVGNSYVQSVTSQTIPHLLGQKTSVSKELQEIQEELEFLIESAASILSQAVMTKKTKKQKFFKREMDKSTAIQYLRNIWTSLHGTRERFIDLNRKNEMKLQLPNPNLLGTANRIIRGIKLYLSSRKAQRGKRSLKKMLRLLSGTRSGSKRVGKTPRLSVRRSKHYSALSSRVRLPSANRHSRRQAKRSVTATQAIFNHQKQSWRMGNVRPRIFARKQSKGLSRSAKGPQALAFIQQGRVNPRSASPRQQPQVATFRPVLSSRRRGRKLSSYFHLPGCGCQSKQTMVARNCDLDLCLIPNLEP